MNHMLTFSYTALYLTREAIYTVENCTFNNNYIDIQFENYLRGISNGMQSDGQYSISGCTFTSDGNNLMVPYANEKKLSAFDLKNVERVRIGVPGGAPNIIENSTFGIKMENSGAEVWNNEFKDISGSGMHGPHVSGTAISLSNTPLFWGRSLVVGETESTVSNVFTNCKNGIYGLGDAKYIIYNNTFGDANLTSNKIDDNAIFLQGFSSVVDIDHGNKFYDYHIGIELYRFYQSSEIEINNNVFYNASLQSGIDFTGTAILMNNKIPISKISKGIIENNDIGVWNSPNFYQSRVGIHLGNTGGFTINDNSIKFNLTTIPGVEYRGIRLENSGEAIIKDNIIENTDDIDDLNNQLTGMRIDNSISTHISCNTINKVGFGFHFLNINGYVPLIENGISAYDLGVNLGVVDGGQVFPTDIGAWQGIPPSSSNGTDGLGLDNVWSDDDKDRAEGNVIQPLPIPWYHDNSENFSNSKCPMPYAGQPNTTIRPEGGQTGVTLVECRLDYVYQARMAGFTDLAEDTARYDGDFATEIYNYRLHAALEYLTADTGRIYMGEADDDKYEDLLEYILSTNIGKYDSVVQFCEIGDWTGAMNLLENIEDTSSYDEYLRTVLNIFINSELEEEPLSGEDSTLLIEIAYLNTIIGGPAVKIARGQLRKEIEETSSGGSRYAQVRKVSSFQRKLWPNPANRTIQINLKDDELFSFAILDGTGRIVEQSQTTSGIINIAHLEQGAYFLKNANTSENEKLLKFVILK